MLPELIITAYSSVVSIVPLNKLTIPLFMVKVSFIVLFLSVVSVLVLGEDITIFSFTMFPSNTILPPILIALLIIFPVSILSLLYAEYLISPFNVLSLILILEVLILANTLLSVPLITYE